MADETTPQPDSSAPSPSATPDTAPGTEPEAPKAKAATVATDAPAPKAKAAKKEALEDKPFGDFISQDYLPALEKAFAAKKVSDLKLSFENNQIEGQWQRGQRQFTVYFSQADLNSQRAFSCSSVGKVSTLEPFLIDERKMTLDLLVFGVMQRLNAQKWFGNN